MKYNLKDISVIIPSYNRPKELTRILKRLPKTIKEIIVVDQSDKPIKLKNSSFIKYYHMNIPSITRARNFGVSKAKGELICFLDDDVILDKDYFESMILLFSKYPKAEGISAWIPFNVSLKDFLIDRLLRKFICLSRYDIDHARINGTFSNTYPMMLSRDINAQWLPGLNMVFKKEVFTKHNMKFDENLLGYTLAEDIDFTYRLYKRNNNGLIISPLTTVKHDFSQVSRPTSLQMNYINNIDHLYFYYKNLSNQPFQTFKLIWSLCWIALGKTLALLSFKKENFLKWINFIKTMKYCIVNINKIKQGKVREWQNKI